MRVVRRSGLWVVWEVYWVDQYFGLSSFTIHVLSLNLIAMQSPRPSLHPLVQQIDP